MASVDEACRPAVRRPDWPSVIARAPRRACPALRWAGASSVGAPTSGVGGVNHLRYRTSNRTPSVPAGRGSGGPARPTDSMPRTGCDSARGPIRAPASSRCARLQGLAERRHTAGRGQRGTGLEADDALEDASGRSRRDREHAAHLSPRGSNMSRCPVQGPARHSVRRYAPARGSSDHDLATPPLTCAQDVLDRDVQHVRHRGVKRVDADPQIGFLDVHDARISGPQNRSTATHQGELHSARTRVLDTHEVLPSGAAFDPVQH